MVHVSGITLFHWRVTSGAGICGFFLTAVIHRVNGRLIAIHARRSRYAYASRWYGPYLLHGVLPGSVVVKLASAG
ncbi:MAG: hypothetical protein M3Z66_19895 [Chloroflexota bacterium]|nr:hypothetical protein [Chloroflexota bacterium]